MKKDSFLASVIRVMSAVVLVALVIGGITLGMSMSVEHTVITTDYKGVFDKEKLDSSGYDWAAHENMVSARDEGRMGFLGPDGKTVLPFIYSYAENFNDGLAMVSGKEGVYFIDSAGKSVIGPMKAGDTVFGSFSEGRARYGKQIEIQSIPGMGEMPIYSYGFMDESGKVVIEPIYEQVTDFSNGKAGFKLDGKWGVLDKEGKVLTSPTMEAKPSL